MTSAHEMVNVRYMVDDVQAAVGFYTGQDPSGNLVELFQPAVRA
jgi:hypothetical protein